MLDNQEMCKDPKKVKLDVKLLSDIRFHQDNTALMISECLLSLHLYRINSRSPEHLASGSPVVKHSRCISGRASSPLWLLRPHL